ncbi:MAG: hypothetical protein OEX22_02660 [Cyclobacteriaceae bacterium]|nr:hypothetical protein [Cyclobacteriaceae bacterium]
MKNLIKYTLIATMTLLSITSNAQTSKVKHYLSITHKVTEYTKWKLVFDETKSDRTEAGIEDIFVKKDINQHQLYYVSCRSKKSG